VYARRHPCYLYSLFRLHQSLLHLLERVYIAIYDIRHKTPIICYGIKRPLYVMV